MKKMTRVFREAARIIAADENAGQGACAALWRAQTGGAQGLGRNYTTPEHALLYDIFLPAKGYFSADGVDDEDFDFERYREELYSKGAHDRRVLALLLLAAMSEAGDL